MKTLLALALALPLSAQDPCDITGPWPGAFTITPGCVPPFEFPVPPLLQARETSGGTMSWELFQGEDSVIGFLAVSPFYTSTIPDGTFSCSVLDKRFVQRIHIYGAASAGTTTTWCMTPAEEAMYYHPFAGDLLVAATFHFSEAGDVWISNTVSWYPLP